MSSANSGQTAEPSAPQTLEETNPSNRTNTKAPLIAGLFAGITASACCAGPLVLLTLGISGSWIGNLSKLEPFRPIFMGLALVFIGLAFRKLYIVPKTCAIDAPCATADGERNQKIVFWLVTIVIIASIAFPWYGPMLLDD